MLKLLLSTILLISATWSQAETLNQLRNRVNTKLTNIIPVIVARQNTYAANHGGKFWQGLLTFSSLPAHTTTTAADKRADRLTAKPTDQATSWADAFPEFNTELFAAGAQIDVYDGPEGVGRGWSIRVLVKHNGIIYERQKGFGLRTDLDFDWRVLDQTPE